MYGKMLRFLADGQTDEQTKRSVCQHREAVFPHIFRFPYTVFWQYMFYLMKPFNTLVAKNLNFGLHFYFVVTVNKIITHHWILSFLNSHKMLKTTFCVSLFLLPYN